MRRRGVGRAGRPGLIGTAARTAVIAGTATAVSGRVAANQAAQAQTQAEARAFREQQAAAVAASPPPATAPSPPVGSSGEGLIEQLSKLGELRQAGLLSDDEFAAAKAKLLG